MTGRSARSALVRSVHLGGVRTRAELAEDLSLNRSTIKNLVDDLVSDGLVSEHPSAGGGAGRPSMVVDPVPSAAWVLAVDAAVDWLTVSAVGWGGTVLADLVFDTGAGRCPETVVTRIADAARRFSASAGPPRAVCVAVPGLVRCEDGLVRVAPNLGWTDVPLGEMVERALGVSCSVANEADLGAVAEHTRGCARGVDDVVYLMAAFGVGCGVISGGMLLAGSGGYAGEVGHIRAGSSSELCGCGRRGCWELLVGQNALRRELSMPSSVTPSDIGSRLATVDSLPDSYVDALEVGVCTIVNLVNPRMLVFGGLFADVMQVPSVMERVGAGIGTSLVGRQHDVELRVSTLGQRISLIGAAESAFAQVLPQL